MSELHLSVRGLHKWYGAVHALRGLDLDIPKGQVVGLIGDNGAGKSTFIKILSGVHKQSEGQIFFEGKEAHIRKPRDAMDLGIETIYQYTAMVPEMSIARNVFIGREKRKWGIRGFGLLDQKAMAKEAMEAIADVGLHLRSADNPIKELSGGQRQGVAIARAMHFRSRMLILDEPTNHLSVKETNKVLDYVRQMREQGVTVIFISHNLHHVHEVTDRIVAFSRGEKVADLMTPDTDVTQMIDIIT
ncbi:MAG: sugar ABC transporter ATP-binding protein [Rhizobiales bacterium]|nr:sugar ABC transporter ATP-binding protein [Hyphomicrobiales bacterium]